MKSNMIRFGTGLMSILLAMSLMAGCGGDSRPNESTASSAESGESHSAITSPDETGADVTGGSAASDPDATGSPTVSGSAAASSPSGSGSKGTTTSNTKSGSQTTTTVSTSNAVKVNPEDYRGTTVRYATWKDPDQNEDGIVVKSFQEKYGIKVQIDIIPQDTYTMDIAGKIASGDQPDVYFDTGMFPSSLSVVQPLEAAKLDLTDPIWDPGMLEISTVGGKPYMINTVGNIWNETACVFYNKKLLEDNNITTPEEYYNAGKWTFEAMTKVMSDVASLGPDYIGGYLDLDAMLGCVGASFYQFEDGKFTNGTSDPMLTNVMLYISNSIKNGLVKGIYYVNRDGFKTGKMGIAVTDAFGLKKTGHWKGMNPSHIGFTYLPDWDANTKAKSTGIFRAWGIIKGAKNPVGAGIFLRYYLDVNNYDTSSAFLSSDAENFFFKLTAGDTKEKYHDMIIGATQYLGVDRTKYYEIASGDPAQVAKEISALKNVVDAEVKKLNDFLNEQANLY